MSSRDDISVRLSPEGTKQVIAALRQVQNEGRKANRQSAQGINVLNKAVAGLKRALPTIGIAATTAGIVGLGRGAGAAAEEMGQLAQITGTTTENLSIFRAEAERQRSTLEEQRVGLVTLAQNLERLRQGNTAVATSFAEVNLAAEDFIGLDTVEAAFKVAEGIAAIEEPARKTAVAKNLLGESGARLIPTLEELAAKGLDGARESAEALGIVMSDQLVADVTASRQALFDIQQQSRGLALQFVGELAPFVTRAMTEVSEETQGKGLSSMRVFGRGVGLVISAVINLFRLLANTVTDTFEIIGTGIGATLAATVQALRFNFDQAKSILVEGFTDVERLTRERNERIANNLQRLVNDLLTPPDPADVPDSAGGGGGGPGVIQDAGVTRARLQAARSRARQELDIQQEGLAAQAEADERAYERGLISLEEYFDRRRAIIERQAALEIANLRAQRDALAASIDTTAVGPQAEAERLRIQTELANLDTQLRVRQLRLSRELAALDGERATEALALADELRDSTTALAELEGRRHEVFEANLADEIRQIQELGARAGQTAQQIEATVARLRQARTRQFEFEEVSRAGQEALAGFQRDAEQIRLAQEAGVITQFEGELRLIELQRQRLDTLKDLAAASLDAAEATGDPQAIAQAQGFALSVAQIAASFRQATEAAKQLEGAALEAFESGITDLLSNIQDISSLEDAFKSLARTVASSMQRIAAEILARQAVFGLLRAFGGGFASGGLIPGLYLGGRIRGYAGGGDVRGPSLPVPGPDKVPIMAQSGEFMLRRSRVAEPGALSFLRAWNAGQFTLAQAMALPRFQTGGLVGPQAPEGGPVNMGGGGARIRMITTLDRNLVTDWANSAEGEEVLLNVVERNSERIVRVAGNS